MQKLPEPVMIQYLPAGGLEACNNRAEWWIRTFGQYMTRDLEQKASRERTNQESGQI